MSNVFCTSDFHFGHAATIFSFKRKDGTALRSFKSVEEMNETMIDRFNSLVCPCDKVYILGDLAMKESELHHLGRLNGHLRLILGNHDTGDYKKYAQYFEAIYSSRLLDRMIFTHIPIHPDCIGRSFCNVHGHSHWTPELCFGPRYLNVSVEMTDFYPISLEDIKKKVQDQIGETW